MMCTAGSYELKYRVTSFSTADLAGSSERSSASVAVSCELNRKAGPPEVFEGFDSRILS